MTPQKRYSAEDFDQWVKYWDEKLKAHIKTQIEAQIAGAKAARDGFITFSKQVVEDRSIPATVRQEKCLELLATYEKQLLTIRAGCLKFLAAETEKMAYHAVNLEGLSPFGPISDAEWVQASAMAAFVKEDLESLAKHSPNDVLRRYHVAIVTEDRPTAWLTERYGPPALKAAGATLPEKKLRQVIAEVNDKAGNVGRRGQVEGVRAFLDGLERDVLRQRTPTETEALNQRFGISQTFGGDRLTRDLVEAGFRELNAELAMERSEVGAIAKLGSDVQALKKAQADAPGIEAAAKAKAYDQYDHPQSIK